jgi:hypothetical protein
MVACPEGLRFYLRARAMIVHQAWNVHHHHHPHEVLEGSKCCCWEALFYLGSGVAVCLRLMKRWRLTCFAFYKMTDSGRSFARSFCQQAWDKHGAEKKGYSMLRGKGEFENSKAQYRVGRFRTKYLLRQRRKLPFIQSK